MNRPWKTDTNGVDYEQMANYDRVILQCLVNISLNLHNHSDLTLFVSHVTREMLKSESISTDFVTFATTC